MQRIGRVRGLRCAGTLHAARSYRTKSRKNRNFFACKSIVFVFALLPSSVTRTARSKKHEYFSTVRRFALVPVSAESRDNDDGPNHPLHDDARYHIPESCEPFWLSANGFGAAHLHTPALAAARLDRTALFCENKIRYTVGVFFLLLNFAVRAAFTAGRKRNGRAPHSPKKLAS